MRRCTLKVLDLPLLTPISGKRETPIYVKKYLDRSEYMYQIAFVNSEPFKS